MPNKFTVHLDCWPVGQGLLMSGRLISDKLKEPFQWVYDCGSTCVRRSIPVPKCIANYNKQIGKKTPLGLLIISHFDHDHINGIVRLCTGRTIKILLLPYLPLWIRFYLAVRELETAGKEITVAAILANAHYNPLRLFEEAGAQIEEVLFVSGNDEILRSPEGDSPISEVSDLTDNERSQYTDFGSQKTQKLTSAICIKRFWEFMPYNDIAPLAKAVGAGANLGAIESAAGAFYTTKSQTDLDLLEQEYDLVFGTGSKNRNIISLFLYCGPLSAALCKFNWTIRHYRNRPLLSGSGTRRSSRDYNRTAQLYTGDGFLKKADEWNSLCNYYGQGRIGRINFLQVMHHGSQNNWHQGLAAKIQPRISMFSSDPITYGHPHPPVWRDFSAYNPVQVGGTGGCHLKVRWDFTAP